MELAKIEAFVRKHHVMTLATVGADGKPWCAHVFYAWMPGEKEAGADANGQTGAEKRSKPGCFVFTTDGHTRHGAEMEANARVAAGIALETRTVGRVQGLQIEGTVHPPEGADLEKARRAYLKRFPYAAIAGLSLRLLEPSLMKLTDNTLGFGKKLIWERS
jgi:uncharacterized protein YhbP (UPF0306 family)